MRLVKILSVMLFLVLVGCQVGSGQVGIRLLYSENNTRNFDELLAPNGLRFVGDDLFNKGYSISLDYWLRLPNYRIEFYPYLSYSKLSGVIGASVNQLDLLYSSNSIGVGVNTNIYPFDLLGDCDCPTFSKQSNFFKKGFFILGGIGADLTQHKFNDLTITNTNRLIPNVRAGIGLDVGISDILTITPLLQYQLNPFYNWPELFEVFRSEPEQFSLGQLQLGLRVGFRFDYKK